MVEEKRAIGYLDLCGLFVSSTKLKVHRDHSTIKNVNNPKIGEDVIRKPEKQTSLSKKKIQKNSLEKRLNQHQKTIRKVCSQNDILVFYFYYSNKKKYIFFF